MEGEGGRRGRRGDGGDGEGEGGGRRRRRGSRVKEGEGGREAEKPTDSNFSLALLIVLSFLLSPSSFLLFFFGHAVHVYHSRRI